MINNLVDSLGAKVFCWGLILWYVFFYSCETLHFCIRDASWISVEQFLMKNFHVKLFSHMHNLSLRWHLTRKTGEIFRMMNRSRNNMQLMSHFLFRFAPGVIDSAVAILVFSYVFKWYFGIIVVIVMYFYTRKFHL